MYVERDVPLCVSTCLALFYIYRSKSFHVRTYVCVDIYICIYIHNGTSPM